MFRSVSPKRLFRIRYARGQTVKRLTYEDAVALSHDADVREITEMQPYLELRERIVN